MLEQQIKGLGGGEAQNTVLHPFRLFLLGAFKWEPYLIYVYT